MDRERAPACLINTLATLDVVSLADGWSERNRDSGAVGAKISFVKLVVYLSTRKCHLRSAELNYPWLKAETPDR